MSINEGKVVLRPEQLAALDSMRQNIELLKQYGVPDEVVKAKEFEIERTKLDFEKANFEFMATTSRKRGTQTVVTKIDVVKYVEAMLPPNGERQDLPMSLKLITAFCMIIDAEVVDNAKKLIELDDLKQYDVMDCIRGIYAVVKKDGWGDRDNKTKAFPNGRLTMLIETLKPDEVEFEVEEEIKSEPELTGEPLPLPEVEQENTEIEKSDDDVATTSRTRKRTS